jgi:hypothetical protein
MEYLEPWFAVEANAEFFERELVSEVGSAHQLYGREMRAVARRGDWIERGMKVDHEFWS